MRISAPAKTKAEIWFKGEYHIKTTPPTMLTIKTNSKTETRRACRRSLGSVITATGSTSRCQKVRLTYLDDLAEEEEEKMRANKLCVYFLLIVKVK